MTTTKDDTKYRLGLDMGTNSIGWAAVELAENGEPCRILDMGVRIFPDGRQDSRSGDGPSNAATRREARGQRRNRDRYLNRRKKFMSLLIQHGLMPQDESDRKSLERLNPYKLRANALGPNKLPAHHIGRALFHLNQRRGFKSNRKVESRDDDTGPVKEAAQKLSEQMAALEYQTLGEFLYQRHRARDSVRFRNSNVGTGKKADYELYPTRQMILDEFDAIWAAQAPNHPNIMTEEARKSLLEVITYNKKAPLPQVGRCTLDPARDSKDTDGLRCAWAHPLAQRFRIWQEVCNLSVQEVGGQSRSLCKDEGDRVARELLKYNKVSFDKIRKLLNLSSDTYFNLESERRKALLGDETAAKLSHKNLFGKTWRTLSLDRQIKVIERLLDDDDDAAVVEWLEKDTALDRVAAEHVVSAFLPERHCRIGLRAIRNILPHMEGGMNYYDAAKAAGYDPAREMAGELSPTGKLPRYNERLQHHLVGTGHPADPPGKRYGRYPNPTVHIGLNQLRRVVNTLIAEYGRPHEAVVEVTRDLRGSKKRRDDIKKEQSANQKKNDDRNKKLKELGESQNYENRLKMRLWEELNPKNAADRRCPFTGECISPTRLFSFSDEVEIEHLIPWSYSLDNSPSNLTVCIRGANRGKGEQTPYEAFHNTPEWEDIKQRAAKLPKNKRWRFGKDARQKFEQQGGFLARQLNETGWLSRMTKEYLTAVVPPNNTWVIPGRLTDTIRYKWGLDSLLHNENFGEGKNRNDHRHHAIDAFVVALTDRSLLQRMSNAYDETRSKIIVPDPWSGFRDQLKQFIKDMVVSYKPDHGTPGVKGKTTGQLHNETAYGLVNYVENGSSEVVVRKELDKLKRVDLEPDRRKGVRDLTLRVALLELWDKVAGEVEEKKIKAEFASQAASGVMVNGHIQEVRRVRVLEEHQNIVPVRKNPKDETEKPYKAYLPDNNEFADIWQMSDGSWQTVVVPTFDANQPDSKGKYKGQPDPTAKRIMRLQIDDMGAMGEGVERRIVRVRKMSGTLIWLDDHNEANVAARVGKKDMKSNPVSARQLQKEGFRKVHVNEIGRVVHDPGPFAS